VSLAKRGDRITAADITKTFLQQTVKRAGKSGVTVSATSFDPAEKKAGRSDPSFTAIDGNFRPPD
jgi:2-polyprenyl-3-methyl-5-hydroxy-6-metoxy-1,4-benzoquinol methylase